MVFPGKEIVEALRAKYPKGTLVELVSMNDRFGGPKPGERGVVNCVDDAGTVFVNWECGSGLGAVYGEDEIRKVTPG